MNRTPLLSRPLYESLPWLYGSGGLAALVISYRADSRPLSFLLGILGLLALVGGLVVWLRRRDYRKLRADYADPDALSVDTDSKN